jgi:hypothetical protein
MLPARPPLLRMRCKPRSRLAPHTASVFRVERVKAKPFGRVQARGLDPGTVVQLREAEGG